MSLVRLEFKKDLKVDLFFLEIYFPADADQPFVTTPARYKTSAAAENDVIAAIAAHAGLPDGKAD